jgi:outer membrane lipoprotein SlyB
MFRGGSLWAGVVSGGVSQFQDTRALANGEMKKSEFAANTATNVTGAVGVMAGIEYGAMLGTSLLPGIGTVAGTIIGGMIGNQVGRVVGSQASGMMFQNRTANKEEQ